MRAFLTLAALSALLLVTPIGCGGGSSDDGSGDNAPAQQDQQGAEPAEHTPESCLGDAGVDTLTKPNPKTWRGVHSSGYVILIRKYGSPAAANRAVEGTTDRVAYQANFFGIFGPASEGDDGAAAKVARCLTGLP